MFRNVPGCSGMFHVPCSMFHVPGFIDGPRKTAFCVRNEITFDFISYLLSRNNLTISSHIDNTVTLSFFRNIILPHGSVLIYF